MFSLSADWFFFFKALSLQLNMVVLPESDKVSRFSNMVDDSSIYGDTGDSGSME